VRNLLLPPVSQLPREACRRDARSLPGERLRRVTAGALALFLAVLCPAAGLVSPVVFRKTVAEVHLTLVATDGRGRPVEDLSSDDFTVTDQGQQVAILGIERATDLPLDLGIVVDLSDSTRRSWEQTRAAAGRLLSGLMRPDDRLFVVAFDSQIELQREVASPASLTEILLEPGRGGQTALYDALAAACQDPYRQALRQPRRSALIVFTDGEDNYSAHSLYDAIAEAQRADVAIYTVSLHSHRWQYAGDDALRLLTTQTGGRDFVVSGEKELDKAVAAIADELRNSYAIFYRPPRSMLKQRFRVVRLQPLSHNLRLRSRAGYYPLPEEGEQP